MLNNVFTYRFFFGMALVSLTNAHYQTGVRTKQKAVRKSVFSKLIKTQHSRNAIIYDEIFDE